MAQQLIERTQSCYLLATTGNFDDTRLPLITNESTIPVYLADSDNANGIPTVGIAQGLPTASTSLVYGKLDAISTNWDALGEPMVDANGNVVYPTMATIITAGVVTFDGLLRDPVTGDARAPLIVAPSPPPSIDIGLQIRGFSGGTSMAASGGLVTVESTVVGTGRVIARNGITATATIWVDLRG